MSWGERSCIHKGKCKRDDISESTCNTSCAGYKWDGETKPDTLTQDELYQKFLEMKRKKKEEQMKKNQGFTARRKAKKKKKLIKRKSYAQKQIDRLYNPKLRNKDAVAFKAIPEPTTVDIKNESVVVNKDVSQGEANEDNK